MAIGYIYKVSVNNSKSTFDKCYYIGKSLYNKCNKNYHNSSFYLKRYKKKWGLDGLSREILCECETLEELNLKEKYYIGKHQDDLFLNGGFCLNIAKGGNGGDTISNNPKRIEILAKRSISESGQNNPIYGKNYQTYGLKQRMQLLRGKTFEEFYGEERAKEIKENYKRGHLGKKHSLETRLKMSLNNIGSKGMHWYNNGFVNKLTFNCPEGFKPGKLYKRKKCIKDN